MFDFGLGQSPFPVPPPVVEALRLAAVEKDYLPGDGTPCVARGGCRNSIAQRTTWTLTPIASSWDLARKSLCSCSRLPITGKS